MFWKRMCRANLLKRNCPNKRQRINRDDDRKSNGIGCGDDLRKRKVGHLGDKSTNVLVRKKRKMSGNSEVLDRNIVADRISELPEGIIHHIFACLHFTEEVVRTSVLSKKWKSMFNSYSIFDYDERWFRVKMGRGKHNRIKAREVQKRNFKGYVEKSLAMRLDLVPCIDKFRLHVNRTDDKLGASMGRWIRAAMDKNVKELEIQMKAKGKKYIIPNIVFESMSITSLKLSGSDLKGFSAIKLSNLTELSIKDVTLLTEDVIKKFEESCQSIEDLRLVCCKGLPRLSILSLPKLRRVEVNECVKLSCIEIAALNLESFWYQGKVHQQCKIDLNDSGNLKNLTLQRWNSTDNAFQDCISKCPLLQKLVLHECNSLERLTILSGKLKSLSIIHCRILSEANIDAPNLYSFEYRGHAMPLYSMNVSGLRKAKLSFLPDMQTSRCIVQYQKLLGNFDWTQGFKLVVYCKKNMKIYEEPKDAYLFPNYFGKLEMTASLAGVWRTVDNWLREYHGSDLTLVTPSDELIKLIHTMLVDREVEPNCCNFYLNKCWRHYIQDVSKFSGRDDLCYCFKWRSR